MTPRERLEQASQLRAQAHMVEEEAVRAALQEGSWLEARAATLLGMPRSSLIRLLTGRLRDLGDEAAMRRARSGYRTGRPPANRSE